MEYIVREDENKLFDRKSGQIKVSDLTPLICAFANAEGGSIVIGVSDKTKRIEGINACGAEKINLFVSAPKDLCRPMPAYREEFLDVTNADGKPDRLLFLHIEASVDQLIRTSNESVYLRISDKTREMKGDDLANNNLVAHEASLYQRLWILSSFVNGCLEVGVKPVIYCKR